jgi:hypothetical protein
MRTKSEITTKTVGNIRECNIEEKRESLCSGRFTLEWICSHFGEGMTRKSAAIYKHGGRAFHCIHIQERGGKKRM